MNLTHARLVDSFLNCQLRESIYPVLAAANGQAVLTEAVGILLSEQSGKLTLQVTGQPEAGPMLRSLFKPTDVVMTEEDHLAIEGSIAGNVFVRTRLLNFRPSIRLKEPQSKLVSELNSICLSSPADADQNWIIEGYLTDVPDGIFTTFGAGETSRLNELELDLTELNIKLTDFSESRKFVQIRLKDDCCDWNHDLIAGAFLYTLSTMAGKRIEWRCLSMRDGSQVHSELFIHKPREGAFYKPIDAWNLSKDSTKETAEKIFRYYVAHGDCAVGYFLGQCWDFTSFDFPIRQLTLGVAIEGIASAVVDDTVKRGAYYEELQQRLRNFIDENVIKPLKESEAASESDTLLKLTIAERLRNVVLGSYELSGKELIKRAFESVGMTVTKEELKAWSDMRNNHAHGNVVFEKLTQADWDRYLVCVRLLNRLIMGLFGCHK